MEAALLRLGARLLLAAGAAAAAVRRAVRVLHGDRAASASVKGRAGAIYGTQLLASIVLFTFFAEATGGAVRCVVDNEALVRKIQFPRMVIPLSVVLLAMFNLALNLVVVLIFGLIQGVRPMLSWLEFPLIVGMLAVLTRDARCCWRRCSSTSGTCSRSGRSSPRSCSTRRPVIIPFETVQQKLSSTPGAGPPVHAQPAGGRASAVPPRDDQSGGAERRARRSAERGGCWCRSRSRSACSCSASSSSTGRRRTSPKTSETTRRNSSRQCRPMGLGGDHPERHAAGDVVEPHQVGAAAERAAP